MGSMLTFLFPGGIVAAAAGNGGHQPRPEVEVRPLGKVTQMYECH